MTGVQTTLSGITMTPTEIADGYIYGEDVQGMLASAKVDAFELIHKCQSIIAAIPAGDGNVTTLNAVITALS